MKTAMVWGASGQIGSYLCEFLLAKGYKVLGVRRRTSTNNLYNLKNCLASDNFHLLEGDITDAHSVLNLLTNAPDEIYNFAAQSHVQTSFNQPIYTTDVIYGGSLNLLEAIKCLGFRTKYFHASSSEMFGNSIDMDGFQRETTPFKPVSPYAVAKTAAHHLGQVYRDAYNLFIVNGILFNVESPRRGENFVTRKITRWIADVIKNNSFYKIQLGNTNACRDWNHVEDTIIAIWTSLQVNEPSDYVVATGKTHSVQEFLAAALKVIHIKMDDVDKFVELNNNLCRPNEVHYLKGDSSYARERLGWSPSKSFADIVRSMVRADLNA